jgi:hypothetical protein
MLIGGQRSEKPRPDRHPNTPLIAQVGSDSICNEKIDNCIKASSRECDVLGE